MLVNNEALALTMYIVFTGGFLANNQGLRRSIHRKEGAFAVIKYKAADKSNMPSKFIHLSTRYLNKVL